MIEKKLLGRTGVELVLKDEAGEVLGNAVVSRQGGNAHIGWIGNTRRGQEIGGVGDALMVGVDSWCR